MEENRNKTWCVYMHTFPNKKKYIGITCRSPVVRWGKTGSGYRDQKLMWNAIQEFGWDNIKHEILFYDLSEEEAKLKEEELITKYKTSLSDYGYNVLSKDSKNYDEVITNMKPQKIDMITRPQLIILQSLYKANAINSLSAITSNSIENIQSICQSYTTRTRCINSLLDNQYICLGLKYGKYYSYFISDKGIEILKEYSLI